MTAREAYDKWTGALAETKCMYCATPYPAEAPVAFDFLREREKDTWREFARRVTPRKERNARQS